MDAVTDLMVKQFTAQSQLQVNAYLNAAVALEASDANYKQLFTRVLDVLRGLKSGDLSIDRVVVTDNGFDVMPPPPDAGTNGRGDASAIAPKVEAVA